MQVCIIACLIAVSLRSAPAVGESALIGNCIVLEVQAPNYITKDLLAYAMSVSYSNSITIYAWNDDKYIIYYEKSFRGIDLMNNLPNIVVPVDFRQVVYRKGHPPRSAKGRAVYVSTVVNEDTGVAGTEENIIVKIIMLAEEECPGIDVISYSDTETMFLIPDSCDAIHSGWDRGITIGAQGGVVKVAEFIFDHQSD